VIRRYWRLAACGLLVAGCASAPERSDLEGATAGRLLSDLDVSSFRNSTGPRRAPSQRTLSDLGVPDVTACFYDRALEGDYDSQQVLLLQRVGGHLIALRFEPDLDCAAL
jgi:hypothetical protein